MYQKKGVHIHCAIGTFPPCIHIILFHKKCSRFVVFDSREETLVFSASTNASMECTFTETNANAYPAIALASGFSESATDTGVFLRNEEYDIRGC